MSTCGHLLLAGCGDIGLRIAQLWPYPDTVTGITRSKSALNKLAANNMRGWFFDLDADEPLLFPATIDLTQTHIVYLAPPATDTLQDRRLEKFLSALKKIPASFSYCSTSGVYGDRNGAWVYETDPLAPLTDRAKRRAWAENFLMQWQHKTHTRTMILRVPGIYGPARLPLDKLAAESPLIRPEESPYTNLIHADDLARIFIACILRGRSGEIYNVADGNSITGTDYHLTVARIAGLPIPPFISLEEAQRVFSPMRLSFINESRRLNVDKMRRELQPELKYTNLEAGILTSLNAE